MEHVVVDLPMSAAHPAFAGHFPGRPIVPGVTLLAEVIEAVLADAGLQAMVGAAPRLGVVKFVAPVGPDGILAVRFEATATALRFEVTDRGRPAASGLFERIA